MLDYQEMVHAQLTFLAQQDKVGFDRAVQALIDRKIDGANSSFCFLAFYANEDACTDEVQRSLAYSDIQDACERFMIPSRSITALEWTIIACEPGEPLDKEQREFLALCQQVQKGFTHAA